MRNRTNRIRVTGALAALSLLAPGCGPSDEGTISVPEVNRTLGPTADPNQPGGGPGVTPAGGGGGGSTIPGAE